MAKQRRSSEKTKQIALAVLGVGLAAAVIYSFFLSGPSARPKRNLPQPGATTAGSTATANKSGAATQKTRQLGTAAQHEAMMQALLSDTTPLNLRLTNNGGKSDPGVRGNIFAYYKEPPPPPVPPPPPPPIQLISLQPQTAVAGTPKPVTLVVNGNKIPADAHILIDGSPRATKRITETQLSTEISAGDYAMARGMTIQVKSKSDPNQHSNTIQFLVQQAPEPQFIYKGRLGSLGQPQANYAVVEITSTRETKRVKVGDTIMGVWRVDGITADGIEVTLTQYGIKRRVQLQDRPK
jgi:hypothetical protein